jgi:hypothetical protein
MCCVSFIIKKDRLMVRENIKIGVMLEITFLSHNYHVMLT